MVTRSRRRSRGVGVSVVAAGRSYVARAHGRRAPLTVEYRVVSRSTPLSTRERAGRCACTLRRCSATHVAPRRDHARGHRSAENSAARARPSTRGSAASRYGAQGGAPARRDPTARRTLPSMPVQRDRMDPDRRPNAGTPHASASITDSPNPSAWRRHEHRVRGVDPERDLRGGDVPHRQQRRVAGGLPRAVVALQRPRGVVREEQIAPVRVQAEPRPGLARGIGRKRSRSMPTGSTATRRVVPAPRSREPNSRETAAGERRQRQDRARQAVRARVEEVVAVQRHHHRARGAPPPPARPSGRSGRAPRRTACRGSGAAARAPRAA